MGELIFKQNSRILENHVCSPAIILNLANVNLNIEIKYLQKQISLNLEKKIKKVNFQEKLSER